MGIRKLAEWIGLSEDDRYSEEELSDELSDEVYVDDTEATNATGLRVAQLPRQSGEKAIVSQPQPADLSRIVSVRPRSYNEARAIGENFRDGVPVIMNLSDMEAGEDKRLVDFAAGLIFGLRGNIERISTQVFLLCPENLIVGPQDKERLASGSFFNQS